MQNVQVYSKKLITDEKVVRWLQKKTGSYSRKRKEDKAQEAAA